MQHSDQPFKELDRARFALQQMRKASSLDDFDEAWKDLLRRLERVWNKAVNHYGKSPKWDSWHGPYLRKRRQDELLAYMVNARGADEHTVAEITERKSASIGIGPGPSGQLYIRRLRTESGKVVEFDHEGDVVFTFTPESIGARPVTNRGVTYQAPTSHLETPVDPRNLLEIAELSIRFYSEFLDSAEKFFVLPSGHRAKK